MLRVRLGNLAITRPMPHLLDRCRNGTGHRAAGTSVTGTHGALMELSSSILLVADDAEARLLVGRTGGFPGPEEIDADLGGIQSPVRLRPRSDARRDSRGR